MTAILMTVLIVAATCAGVVTSRWEGDSVALARWAWVRLIVYWLATLLVTYELAAGALWDLLRIEYVQAMLAHLGYPQYLLLILGVWRTPGALALLIPRFPRLKEWAYAGAFFDYTGAAASHFLAGDHVGGWAPPLMFTGLTLASWALRPASRRMPGVEKSAVRSAAWVVPICIVAAILLVGYWTLPKGAPQL